MRTFWPISWGLLCRIFTQQIWNNIISLHFTFFYLQCSGTFIGQKCKLCFFPTHSLWSMYKGVSYFYPFPQHTQFELQQNSGKEERILWSSPPPKKIIILFFEISPEMVCPFDLSLKFTSIINFKTFLLWDYPQILFFLLHKVDYLLWSVWKKKKEHKKMRETCKSLHITFWKEIIFSFSLFLQWRKVEHERERERENVYSSPMWYCCKLNICPHWLMLFIVIVLSESWGSSCHWRLPYAFLGCI